MKKLQLLLAAGALFISAGLYAQNEREFTLQLNYAAAAPVGTAKNVLGNNSFKGFGAELMYHLDRSWSIGVETGSQLYYQKTARQLYKATDGSDISGVLTNSINTAPILLKGRYNFLPEKAVQPYIALAAGGNIITYDQYLGGYSNDGKTKFAFAARPEAGIYVPFRKYSRAGFSLGAGYSFMPFNYAGISNLNNITARVGISFPLGQ